LLFTHLPERSGLKKSLSSKIKIRGQGKKGRPRLQIGISAFSAIKKDLSPTTKRGMHLGVRRVFFAFARHPRPLTPSLVKKYAKTQIGRIGDNFARNVTIGTYDVAGSNVSWNAIEQLKSYFDTNLALQFGRQRRQCNAAAIKQSPVRLFEELRN